MFYFVIHLKAELEGQLSVNMHVDLMEAVGGAGGQTYYDDVKQLYDRVSVIQLAFVL